MPGTGLSRLHAVVIASEARAAGGAAGLRVIACGSIAGLAGPVRAEAAPRAAVRHDRTIGRALAACSSIVPFRLGTDARSSDELRALLAANEAELARALARLAGRAEMGLKVKLPSRPAAGALLARLASIRDLARCPADRRERLIPGATGQIFAGCYLVSRGDIEAFWSSVEALRSTLRGAPVLGSGPWAAYSFCDLTLRPGPGRNATGRAPPHPVR